jgi:hypothetical protein
MADVLFGTFNLEYSEAFGTGQFGTVTITGDTTKATVTVNVGDSWLIDTGGPHQPFAFNLVDGGTDDPVVTNVQLDTFVRRGRFERSFSVWHLHQHYRVPAPATRVQHWWQQSRLRRA